MESVALVAERRRSWNRKLEPQGRWVSRLLGPRPQRQPGFTSIAVARRDSLVGPVPRDPPTLIERPAAGTATAASLVGDLLGTLPQLRTACPRDERRYEVLDLARNWCRRSGNDPAPPGRAARRNSSAFPSHLPACLGDSSRLHRALLKPVGQRCALQPGSYGVVEVRFCWVRTSGGSWRSATTGCGFQRTTISERMLSAFMRRPSRVRSTGGQRALVWRFVQQISDHPRGTGARANHPGGGAVMKLVLA